MRTDVVEGECMEDGYDAASGATSTIVFTGGNRVVSGTQTVTATAHVIHGGVDITSELPASAFTWTRDSGRSAEDATWNAAHQNVKQVTLTSADMNGDVQIACSVQGDAATFGSITVGSDYAVSYTPSAADAGDTLALSSGILSVETASNTYSLDNGSLKVVSGFTGTVTASATVFAERPAKTVEFSYNLDGMRAEKKVTRLGVETTTSYTYSGKKLTHLVCGNDSMHFFYDGQGRPSIVQYDNGSTASNYTYVHNLQGDIVGILNSSGALVVEYKYDAWGKSLSTTGTLATTLGMENPFRYRGYVYDEETGYYYLRSRYYDSGLKRFVNADLYLGRVGLSSNNIFLYCKNNAIMCIDPNGKASEWLFALRHPIIAHDIGKYKEGKRCKNITTTAVRFAISLGLNNPKSAMAEGTQVNAVRHALWTGIISGKYGKGDARDAVRSHEEKKMLKIGDSLIGKSEDEITAMLFSSHKEADSVCDILNNEIALEMDFNGMNANQICSDILDIYHSAGFWVINENNSDGGFRAIPHRAQ